MEVKLLIVAPFRSGTRHTASMLNKAGFRISHANVTMNGTVSPYFCPYKSPAGEIAPKTYVTKHVLGEHPNMYVFEDVWHQTRETLATIASIRETLSGPYFRWAKDVYDIEPPKRGHDRLEWAVHLWYMMSKDCERISTWRFKVEELFRLPYGITDTTTVPHWRDLTWEHVRDNSQLYDDVKRMSDSYGY